MKYQKKIEAMAKEEGTIRAVVAQDILDSIGNYENCTGYLKDLFYGGCQSGTVSGLIYFADTKAFYIKYTDEIDELKEEIEEEMGESLKIGYPSYNWLAWFGYEETARKISNELGLEI